MKPKGPTFFGYSSRIVKLNKKANGRLLGVQLGRACITNDVSVAHVAGTLGVSRQTVYNWFTGVNNPQEGLIKRVQVYLKKLTV